MPQFTPVAKTGEIPPGERKRVEVRGERITLFNIEGRYFAILDTCPHKKTASLVRGPLDGLAIRCPSHGYRFDLTTGDCDVNPSLKTRVFPVRVLGEDVCLELGGPGTAGGPKTGLCKPSEPPAAR